MTENQVVLSPSERFRSITGDSGGASIFLASGNRQGPEQVREILDLMNQRPEVPTSLGLGGRLKGWLGLGGGDRSEITIAAPVTTNVENVGRVVGATLALLKYLGAKRLGHIEGDASDVDKADFYVKGGQVTIPSGVPFAGTKMSGNVEAHFGHVKGGHFSLSDVDFGPSTDSYI